MELSCSVSRSCSLSSLASRSSSSSSSVAGIKLGTREARERERSSRRWSRVRASVEGAARGASTALAAAEAGIAGGRASPLESREPTVVMSLIQRRRGYFCIYGAMALAGNFICSITGVDNTGGFDPSLKAIVDGLGYAAPPIMALLFILDDEVVKYSPHARAIRDVEDEELRSFFYGMSPWQFILIVIASSVGEELFYRVAVQGSLADIFLKGTELVKDSRGIASLTGMLPLFVPFAQAFAAVITAALTGSLYYIATAPKDPTYVVAPVLQSRSGREDLKKLFAAWYERRQMRKIYSPLLEGLLALYLGYEWIQTDNILAPMITHGIYSAVVLGHGLLKIHDHRRRSSEKSNGNPPKDRIHSRILEGKAVAGPVIVPCNIGEGGVQAVAGPVIVPCNIGEGGVQGFRWYGRRLRIDEDGDVADEFLDEVLPQDRSMSQEHRTLPRFEVKYNTRPAPVRKQAITINGNVHPSMEYKGMLRWV
ncbi:uncharacterized protein A4U43_C10F3470 [Asparagus officinalis]|uniref:CAAX prenyl protease 2/Lysostaphin resistance protein A-like domain-containing protein n=1 Tax=Asparagus officinalis TaxID=4686 RepID=A0A5P1E4T5_ASPOF|nr:uncharacterized protein A4U43_C10F3470 [Asparagus officinalis]